MIKKDGWKEDEQSREVDQDRKDDGESSDGVGEWRRRNEREGTKRCTKANIEVTEEDMMEGQRAKANGHKPSCGIPFGKA